MSTDLWTERYRPKTLDDYVWNDAAQRSRVEQLISDGALSHMIFTGPPGCGKAQPLDSSILTTNGWIKMGDATLGQEVVCPSGRISKITGIFPQGEQSVYRMTFEDGRCVECCSEHLWEVSHSDWDNRVRILPTDAILDKLHHLNGISTRHKLKIRLIDEVDFGDPCLPIPAYALGCLLGDGYLRENGSIMFSTADAEMINYLSESLGSSFNIVHVVNSDYRITVQSGMLTQTNKKGIFLNPLKVALQDLGLLGVKSPDKFIPDVYKQAKFSDRLDIIRGLLDTDGSVSQPKEIGQGGTVVYYTSSEKLASDIQWMVWSIGGTAHIAPKQTSYTYKGKLQKGLPSFGVTIRYREPKKLFKLTRKLNRCAENYQYKRSLANVIQKVEKTEITKPMQCIMIDDPEHLYITDNFIPTHNTSLAKLLLIEMKIPSGDILEINASRERKVDEITERFQNFVNTWAMGPSGIKYILMEEADALSPTTQKMLRSDLESYSDMCRVIFTANYAQKIIPAIHDRCQSFQFAAMPRDDFMVRIGEILTKENIDFDLETLQPYVDKAYPSLRKCINLVQEHSSSGKLSPLNITDDDSKDYLIDMAAMFMKGKYLEARKMIVAQARPEEYPDLYRYFYRNLDMFSADQTKQEDILLIIANAIYRNSIVSDQEINLAATMVEICRCAAGK